jgi:hypothetical protein
LRFAIYQLHAHIGGNLREANKRFMRAEMRGYISLENKIEKL